MHRTLKHRFLRILAALAFLAGTWGCSVVKYSFSGTSIQPDVKTITINLFEYTAQRVNPSLSNDLTEAIRTQFRKMTSLEQVDVDGDMDISGAITGYEVRASAVTANEVAAQNRLTINIKLEFTNHLATAKEYRDENVARADLKELQTTGYFFDLQVFQLGEDGKAHRPDERDMIPW